MTTPETTTASSSSKEETVVLSPFVVTAEEDTGYKATSTLAGTRLRSDLKDIAASISVVTKDFMTDVNATDLGSLLVYTLGTEVGGYGGNYSAVSDPGNLFGDYKSQLAQLTPTNRIRGLDSADTARDYFASGVPVDSYNIDRVEINRGANSILFGLGSPAGIINTVVIKADTRKTKTKVIGQYGEYGSYRGSLDTNQVLIPGKLAVRVATVYADTKYRVEDTFNRKKAITATLTYQPFKDTTIRLTHEHGRIDSTNPQIRPPYDFFTWWWLAGKPVWDPSTFQGHLLGTPQAPFTTTTVFKADGTRAQSPNGVFFVTGNFGGWRGSEAGLIFQDPNSGKLGGVNIGGGQTVDAIGAYSANSVINPVTGQLTSSGMIGINDGASFIKELYQINNPYRLLYSQEPQITDPHIFDFYHQQMDGPNQYEWGEWTNTNLSFEQTFLNRKAGIEVAYQKESIDNGYMEPSDYQLNIDINEKLPNGAPNPNFLRPITASFGNKGVGSSDNEAYRMTAYYQLDLRKVGPAWLGKFLGHHDLQANYMAQESFNESLSGNPYANNLDYLGYDFGQGGNMGGNNRIVALVSYLGPSVANAATPDAAHAQAPTAVQDPSGLQTMTVLYHKNPGNSNPASYTPWQTGTFGLITNGRYNVDNTVSGAARSDMQVHSLSSVIQSYWLDDTVVSTLGFRTDRVWSFNTGAGSYTPLGTRNIQWTDFYPALGQVSKDSSTTWGIVGHLPKFIQRYLPLGTQLSVFYNHADNFRVSPVRYTITGSSIDPQAGKTREYGIELSTFHDKLDLKVAHYETVSANATVGSLGNALNQMAIMAGGVVDHDYASDNAGNTVGIAQFENWLSSPAGQVYTRAFGVSFTPNPDATSTTTRGHYATWSRGSYNIQAASDLKSTGLEFEMTYNPLKNWRITANASRTEAVRTNIAPEFKNFVFGPGGLVPLIQNPDGSKTPAGSLIGSPITQTAVTDLYTFVYGNIINNGVATTYAQEGTPSNELRKWHYNLVTDYQFDDRLFSGMLNGFSVGGAMRWEDKGVIGYAGTTIVSGGNSLRVSDVNHQYFGPSLTTYDLWFGYQHKLSHGINWKVQLNLRNVGVGNDLVPLQANPDGKVVMWYIRQPQTWTLTNTFEF